MAPVTVELQVPSSLPASKNFNAFLDFDNIVLKVAPQTFKSIEILEGNGGVGTIKIVNLGEAVPYKYMKQRLDGLDKESFTVNFTVIDADKLSEIFESVNYEVKFVPSTNGGSILKQKATYNLKGAAELKDEHVAFEKVQLATTSKAIEDYVLANPGAY